MEEKLPKSKADAVVDALDVRLDSRICFMCVGIVSMALESGSRRKLNGALQSMTPQLWHDGLSEIALEIAKAGVDRGVAGADAALADLETRGGHGPVARAIVRRLAEELSRLARTSSYVEERARTEERLAAADWN